jgi:hypothetical protein
MTSGIASAASVMPAMISAGIRSTFTGSTPCRIGNPKRPDFSSVVSIGFSSQAGFQ